jgi:hypothetical protein
MRRKKKKKIKKRKVKRCSMRHKEKPRGYITTTVAREIISELGFKASLPTVIKWVYKYGLGYKVGGHWYIKKTSLIQFLTEEPIYYAEE